MSQSLFRASIKYNQLPSAGGNKYISIYDVEMNLMGDSGIVAVFDRLRDMPSIT